ncbi:hypothetical protein JXB28_01350 [Candidatus Woesearchaeota archaeon]|nr:hypothetical protein [Candidatus Woesearchaeota archaeon]
MQAATVHNIIRTLRSIHNQQEFAYISVPITSGKMLFDALSRTLIHPDRKDFLTGPASSADKSKEVPIFKEIIREVISENYAYGHVFLQELETRVNIPILYPADLVPRGDKWTQEHFQALWLTLISEHATQLHMSPDWQYSSGAAEEFTHAYQLKLGVPRGAVGKDASPFYNSKMEEDKSRERMRSISVYNHKGKALSLEDGIRAIDGVLPWIKEHSFNTERLENARNLLVWTSDKIEKGYYQ